MIIYSKEFKNCSTNNVEIYLLHPTIYIRKKQKDWLLEDEFVYQIDLDTVINFVHSRIGWSFKMRILGFGIAINRQTSY